uniref:Uncharacterized protein n=1 Tax=Triticum urartu TaxID=4572 RepID=A0A8R7PDW6_TRIUA
MAKSLLAMKTGPAAGASEALLESDLRELTMAARKLANHAIVLGGGIGFIGTFLQWLAFAAAVYLLVLDKTNWKTNMLTGLLVPYIFFTMPGLLFGFIRGEIGSWVAFVFVVLRLFFPRHFPGTIILLSVSCAYSCPLANSFMYSTS